MGKDEFILKVQSLTDLFNSDDHEWARELYEEDGYRTSISVGDLNGDFMIDDHITSYYPELDTLGIDEPTEGEMFTTLKGTDGIVKALQRMGFNAVKVGDNTKPEEVSLEDLEKEMYKAVSTEDYEELARLRDIIRDILRNE